MQEHLLELIRRVSCELPDDILDALRTASGEEENGSPAEGALAQIVANCELAKGSDRPICQDTGVLIWHVYHPQATSQIQLAEDILRATREATKLSYLRPNSVDSVTGANSGDNTGVGMPVIHFHQWEKDEVVCDLLLKGGGSENVSALYSLPDSSLKADRDLEGVRRAVVDAVFQAQGKGCGPGIIGVCIGGDRATSMEGAKEQLFRNLRDKNPDGVLAELETTLFKQCNELGIGPMGFGGKTTVLGVKIGKRHRLPASFFVSVAYLCWAARRASLSVVGGGKATYSQKSQIAMKYNSPVKREKPATPAK